MQSDTYSMFLFWADLVGLLPGVNLSSFSNTCMVATEIEPALNPYGLPSKRPRLLVRKTATKKGYCDVGKPGPGMCTTLKDSHVVVQCVLKSILTGLVAGHAKPRALCVPPPLRRSGSLCRAHHLNLWGRGCQEFLN